MKKVFLTALLGIPVTLVIMTLVLGDPTIAVAVFALSIVCTAGISLVVWIPVLWLVGTITWAVFTAINPNFMVKSVHRPKTRENRHAMDRYLTAVKNKGRSLENAKIRLQGAGWETEEIDASIRRVFKVPANS